MQFSPLRSAASAAGYAFLAGTLFGAAGTGVAAVLGSAVFDDVPRGSYYDEAVGEMYGDGIIKGYEGTNNFGPDDYVTRAQVAVMLQRFKDEINGTGSSDDDDDSSSSRSRSSGSSSSSSSSSYNPKGALRFSTSAMSIMENQNKIAVSVVRVGGNQGEVSVEYAVTGGTASAGSDFEAISGTLTFDSKETSQTFTITLKDDSSSEGDETVMLTLSSPEGGAGLGSPSTATLTLKDNENGGSSSSSTSSSGNASSTNANGTLDFSAETYMINENGGSLTVTRTGGSSGTVGVNYATSDGTGKSGTNYSNTSGTLSFSGGETSKTFTVPVTDDSSLTGNKTFTLTLSSPTGGANIVTPATATVSIFDNENTDSSFGSGSLKFAKSTYSVTESEQKAVVTVQRVGGAQGTVTVNYATVNGTAFSGADYTSTSGTLTFAHGETSKTITVPVTKDTSAEGEDNFYINLTSPSSNTTLISPNSVTVTISG